MKIFFEKQQQKRFVNKTLIYFNYTFGKKQFKELITWFSFYYGEQETLILLENLKDYGYILATQVGLSLNIDDLKNQNIEKIKKKTKFYLKKNKISSIQGGFTSLQKMQNILSTWNLTNDKIFDELSIHLKKKEPFNPITLMAFSGARGNLTQVRQLMSMRGLMADAIGNIIELPIRNSLKDGISLTEYFISCYGARKGVIDTALRTAKAGYLTRRLIFTVQHLFIRNFDCNTTEGFWTFFPVQDTKQEKLKFLGRVLLKTNSLLLTKNIVISFSLLQKLNKEKLLVAYRSTLTCQAHRSLCQLCYGWDCSTSNLIDIGEAVGICAGQSIGEPGTQLTMRTFHTGGVGFLEKKIPFFIRTPFDGIIRFHNTQTFLGSLLYTPGIISQKNLSFFLFFNMKSWYNMNKLQHLKKNSLFLEVISTSVSVNNLTDPKRMHFHIYREQLTQKNIVFVQEGALVKKGQILLQIFPLNETTIDYYKYPIENEKNLKLNLNFFRAPFEGEIFPIDNIQNNSLKRYWISSVKSFEYSTSAIKNSVFSLSVGDFVTQNTFLKELQYFSPIATQIYVASSEKNKAVPFSFYFCNTSKKIKYTFLNHYVITLTDHFLQYKFKNQELLLDDERNEYELEEFDQRNYINVFLYQTNSILKNFLQNKGKQRQIGWFEWTEKNLPSLIQTANNTKYINNTLSFCQKSWIFIKKDKLFNLIFLQWIEYTGLFFSSYFSFYYKTKNFSRKKQKTAFIFISFPKNFWFIQSPHNNIKGPFFLISLIQTNILKNKQNYNSIYGLSIYNKNLLENSFLESKKYSNKNFHNIKQEKTFFFFEKMPFYFINYKIFTFYNNLFFIYFFHIFYIKEFKNYFFFEKKTNLHFKKFSFYDNIFKEKFNVFLKTPNLKKKKMSLILKQVKKIQINVKFQKIKNIYTKQKKYFSKLFQSYIYINDFLYLNIKLYDIEKNIVFYNLYYLNKQYNFFQFYTRKMELFFTQLQDKNDDLSLLFNYQLKQIKKNKLLFRNKIPNKPYIFLKENMFLFNRFNAIDFSTFSLFFDFEKNEKLFSFILFPKSWIFPKQNFFQSGYKLQYEGEIQKILQHYLKEQDQILIIDNNSILSLERKKKNYDFLNIGFKTLYGDYISMIPSNVVSSISGQIIKKTKKNFLIHKGSSFSLQSHILPTNLYLKKENVLGFFFSISRKTNDIIQGIPRIEKNFEIQSTSNIESSVISSSFFEILTHYGTFPKLNRQNRGYILEDQNKGYNALLSMRTHLIVQIFLVEKIIKAYREQGVDLNEKHVELIIREMTNKVQILDGFKYGLIPGECFDFTLISNLNKKLYSKKQKEILYAPKILGITLSTKKSSSFLTSISFQEIRDAIVRTSIGSKRDYLLGLHENILLENTIYAGSGFLLDKKVKIENFKEFSE